jgi:hypothetical protein
MPDLEIEIITNEEVVIDVDTVGTLDLELEIGNYDVSDTLVTEVEVVEVTLPDRLDLTDQVNNEGDVPGFILLDAAEPVPGGTPVGTIVLRRE